MAKLVLLLLLSLCGFLQLSNGNNVLRIPLHKRASTTSRLGRLMRANNDPAVVQLINNYDSEYFGKITIGSQGQQFRVAFDLSQSNLWVPSYNCTFDENFCDSHSKFNEHDSESYTPNGTAVQRNSPLGEISGYIGTDMVTIVGLRVLPCTFIEITYENGLIYPNSDFDGLLGMAFPEASIDGIETVMHNLIRGHELKEPVFSMYYAKFSEGSPGGELILGGSDPSKYQGDLITVNVTKRGLWQFEMTGLDVGKKLSMCSDGCQAYLDSVFPWISGPAEGIVAINKALGAKDEFTGFYYVNCDAVPNLPNITLTVGGKPLVLTPQQYITVDTDSTVCYTLFMTTPAYKFPMYVFGVPFLQAFYVRFDLANAQMGMAPIYFGPDH